MPRNSPTGFVCAFFATFMGFALIWHIWWMVIVGLVGAFATFVVFAWRDHDEYEIPADEVARIDRANSRAARHGQRRGERRDVASQPHDGRDPHHVGTAWHSTRQPGPGAEADRHRLRLLDLPAQRHRHVLGFFAAYAVLSGETAGGPDRRASCST